MKITNPTKNKIDVLLRGKIYSIEPEGVLNNIPEDIAREWQEEHHKFLVLRKDNLEDVKPEPVIELQTPVLPNTKEVEEEVVVEEKEPEVEVKEKVKKTNKIK